MPKISVVIPLYNKAPHISRSLNSVLNQTISCHEIIIVDDGSTDGGGEIVKTFTDPRIKLIRQVNQGASAARNRGISEARGELIAFLDADDEWKPGFLEVILHLWEKYPQAGAFATAFDLVNSSGSLRRPEFKVFPFHVKEGLITNYFRQTGKFRPVWSSAVAIPKTVLEEVGGFPDGVAHVEDLDTWLRIALRYPIAWTSKSLAIYYQNAVNRTFGFYTFHEEPRISQTARTAIQAGLVPQEMVPDLLEYAAIFQLSAARGCIIRGQSDLALRMLDYAKSSKRLRHRCEWWLLRFCAIYPGLLGPLLLKPILILRSSCLGKK